MSRTRILIAEGQRFSTEATLRLRSVAEVRLEDLDRARLLACVGWAQVLWVRLRHRIGAEVMDRAPHLSMIVSATTGLDHIDLEEAHQRQVRILSLRGETDFLRTVRATAEHTLALTLALLRKLPGACRHVLEGGWDRDPFWGSELHEKTVGIIGYGRLGRLCAGYFQALGARVLASDPRLTQASDVTLMPLHEMLPLADVVSLHASLNDPPQVVLGREQFARFKPGAWLINTSRGQLLDEGALLEALQAGTLRGAALDVVQPEEGPHPLVVYARSHENLLITPHIGGATHESVAKTELFLADKLLGLL